jgi:hypothetical protein
MSMADRDGHVAEGLALGVGSLPHGNSSRASTNELVDYCQYRALYMDTQGAESGKQTEGPLSSVAWGTSQAWDIHMIVCDLLFWRMITVSLADYVSICSTAKSTRRAHTLKSSLESNHGFQSLRRAQHRETYLPKQDQGVI